MLGRVEIERRLDELGLALPGSTKAPPGTGAASVPLDLGEPLKSWVLDPDLNKYRRLNPAAVVNVAIDKIAGGVPEEIREDYIRSYEGDRFVESMAYVRRYPRELPALAELLPDITVPVTIVNGRRDPVVPPGNAEFLHVRLPNSRLEVLDAAHFVWEEQPAVYASIVLDSIHTGVHVMTIAEHGQQGGI